MEETPEGYYTAMAALCGAKIMNMFDGRMECELVAQAILHEVTANVSLEDVRVWRPDPSSVEGRARQAIEAAAGSDPNGAGKDHRSRIRRIRDGASGLGDSPFWAAYWKMAEALINRTMVH